MRYAVISSIAAISTAHAAITISLPGNSEFAKWGQLRSSNYPGAGGSSSFVNTTGAWAGPIAANTPVTSSAVFSKVSGGGYFASTSVYDAGTSGNFKLADASPITNLKTLVLQLDTGAPVGVAPVLHYNGGSQSLLANFNTTSTGNYLSGFGGPPSPTTNYAWQWDFSSVAGSITSYEVTWGSLTNNHLTQYEIHLSTGDSFVQVVPEPSAALIGSLATLALFRRRRN